MPLEEYDGEAGQVGSLSSSSSFLIRLLLQQWSSEKRHLRWLEEESQQEQEQVDDGDIVEMNDTEHTSPNDWETLRTTLILYLPAFCVVTLLFCAVRRKYPRVYNVRNSVERLRTSLTAETHGWISWMWRLLELQEEDLVQDCGLDAVCVFRLLRVGLKLSLAGCFCSCFLLPAYVTAESSISDSITTSSDLDDENNRWVTTTTAHLPKGSNVFTATVLAAYLLFGYTLYLVYTEFRWFTLTRAQFLSAVTARSYSIFVTGIPLQLRSDNALRDFFRRVLSHDAVATATVALHIPTLQAKVAQRQRIKNRLDHNLALRDKQHTVPTMAPALGLGECVPAIPHLERQLQAMDAEIAQLYKRIQDKQKATARATKTAVKASYALARQSTMSIRHLQVPFSPTASNTNDASEEDDSESDDDDDDDDLVVDGSTTFVPAAAPARRPTLTKSNGMITTTPASSSATATATSTPVSHCTSICVGTRKVSFSDQQHDDSSGIDASERSAAGVEVQPVVHTTLSPENSSSGPTSELGKKWLAMGMAAGDTKSQETTTATAPTTVSPSKPLRPPSILRASLKEGEAAAAAAGGANGGGLSRPKQIADRGSSNEGESSFSFSTEAGCERILQSLKEEASSDLDDGGVLDDDDNSNAALQPIQEGDVNLQQQQQQQGRPRQRRKRGLLSKRPLSVGQAGRTTSTESRESTMSDMDGDSNSASTGRSRGTIRFLRRLPSRFSNRPPKEKLEEIFSKATSLVGLGAKDNEGKPLHAGFVTFSKLSAVNAALQVVHSNTPSQIIVTEAPDPDKIIWHNVGLYDKTKQAGKLLSTAITTVLIIFWTVPVTAIVSLTEVDQLTKYFPFLEDWLEAMPWLEGFLNQIAPLTLTLLNSVILPVTLKAVSRLDGVIGISFLESALFVKLTAFYIVQTFLIASLAGSITKALSKLKDAKDVFRYLAKTLPPQAVFFIQLVLIGTVIGVGTELLRTTALVQATLRKFLGPRLTKEERDTPWIGLRPLSNPRFFLYARVLAKINLFFLILLTFAVLSPLICCVMAFAFFVTEIGARHQLVYVYPILDSGGKLWLQFIKILLICVLIAEGILMSYMGIVHAAAQFYMMIPLIVVTVLFEVYLLQRHFNVARRLSSEDCVKFDVRNDLNETTAKELFGRPYLQPALRAAQNLEMESNDEEEGRLASSY